MPEFKFRNLTVKVGDTVDWCAAGTRWPVPCRRFYTQIPCRWPTRIVDCDRLTTITYVDCRVTSLPDITDITDPCGGFSEYIPGPELDLDVLKKQLHDQIQQIEQLQVRQAEAAKPSSVEEIDALKAGLADAMKELDERRAELAKDEKA